jgi:hypothetical protein
MIAFGHTAVGAGVGLIGYHLFGSQSPVIGLTETAALGIVSHYLTDFIPHGHFFRKTTPNKLFLAVIFDLFVSLILFTLVSFINYGLSIKFWYILFGIGGSQFPDVIGGLYFLKIIPHQGFFKIENKFHWYMVHWHGTLETALLWGKRDIWQVATVLIFLYALFKF